MKILFITYYYLQENSASAIQTRRFIKGIVDTGIKITVLTKKVKLSNIIINKNIEIIQIQGISTNWLGKILRKSFSDLWMLPDLERFFWNPFVLNAVKNKIILTDYNYIHTIGYPFSTHLLGLKLNLKYKLPWIAHFYDPWVNNSYRNFFFNCFKKINIRMEENVSNKSTFIIHSNNIILEDWITRYGDSIRQKIKILPFCSEIIIKTGKDTANSTDTKHKTNQINISHIGSIYGERSLIPLISSLESLINSNPKLKDIININLVGFISKKEITHVKNSKISQIFTLTGSLTHDQSINQLLTSDILLIIEGNETKSLFFPSKLIEYFTAQKPIIGIAPKLGIVTELLKQSGHKAFDYKQTNEISIEIQRLIDEISQNKKIEFDQDFYKNYLTQNVVDYYIKNLLLVNKNQNSVVNCDHKTNE